ncbi:MAG: hypothetical protein HYT27_03500 [Parcubacteria group bacterium]|nr:hypothetical protein [Parcubacteria group bacterium]
MRQKIIFLLCMIGFVAVALLFAERDMVIGTKQFEALVSLCERHRGLARVIYRHETDAENLDFDSKPIPKHVVCKDNTKLSVPKKIQTIKN